MEYHLCMSVSKASKNSFTTSYTCKEEIIHHLDGFIWNCWGESSSTGGMYLAEKFISSKTDKKIEMLVLSDDISFDEITFVKWLIKDFNKKYFWNFKFKKELNKYFNNICYC